MIKHDLCYQHKDQRYTSNCHDCFTILDSKISFQYSQLGLNNLNYIFFIYCKVQNRSMVVLCVKVFFCGTHDFFPGATLSTPPSLLSLSHIQCSCPQLHIHHATLHLHKLFPFLIELTSNILL